MVILFHSIYDIIAFDSIYDIIAFEATPTNISCYAHCFYLKFHKLMENKNIPELTELFLH